MTRTRISAGALLLLLLLPALAAAGQINLRWNACWGDGGIMNRVFACNTNAGTNGLTASFILPQDVSGVTAVSGVIDYAVTGGSVPDWWQFRISGTCRAGSLGVGATAPVSAVACMDWASAVGSGSAAVVGFTLGIHGPSSARMVVSNALPTPLSTDLSAHQEYYAFSVFINNQKTVGSGSCAGCNLGACIGLQQIQLEIPLPFSQFSLGSVGEGDQLATWQGGASLVRLNDAGHLGCPLATPTRNTTWGSVKSLYR